MPTIHNEIKKVHILLCGYYFQGNTGDDLMMNAIVRSLDRYGEVKVTASFIPAEIDWCDILLIGGGTHTRPWNIGGYEQAKYARERGKKVVYYAQTIEDGHPLFDEHLGRADYITVRDAESRRVVERHGFRAILASDPLFEKRQRTVGVSLRKFFAAPPDFVERIAGVLDDLSLDYKIVFLPYTESENPEEDDISYHEEVIRLMKSNPGRTSYEQGIGSVDLLIGMRLHALINAVNRGKRVVGIKYDSKVGRIMSDLALEDMTVSYDEVNKITDIVRNRIFRADALSMRERVNEALIEKLCRDIKGGPLPGTSLVLQTCDDGTVIRDTLESLIHQTMQDWELIVVDKGNAVETKEMVLSLADARMRYYNFGRNSVNFSRNIGTILARGEIIVLIEAGQIGGPQWLESVRTEFSRPDRDIICSPLVRRQAGGDEVRQVIAFRSDVARHCPLNEEADASDFSGLLQCAAEKGFHFYTVEGPLTAEPATHEQREEGSLCLSPAYGLPMVSIIIATCNRPGFLKEALQSVMSQIFRSFEVIVVNDGGEDVSEIVQLFNTERVPVISLRHDQRRGPSAARNTGLKAAKGKYIAYLDDDDIYYPNHIEVLVASLERNKWQVAYTDAYQAFQTWVTDRYVTAFREVTYSREFDLQKLLISNYIPMLNIMHRRDILDKCGLFDEALETHEDWDLYIRFAQIADFHHIKMVTAEFRTRSDGTNLSYEKRHDFLRTLRVIYDRYAHLVTDAAVLDAQKKGCMEALGSRVVASNMEAGNREPAIEGPLVSVIVPTSNRPGMLSRALASILSQTYRNLEAIVVNDACEDVSDMIDSCRDSRVVYIRHEHNRGRSAARNTGLKAARGIYIAYLDDDDIFYPDHVETLAGFLEKNGEKVAYTDAYQAVQTPIADAYVTVGKNVPFSADFDRRQLLVDNYIPINTIMHRKELLDETGLFDEEMETHEDWDLLIRLSMQCDFHHIRRLTTEFRTRDNSTRAYSSFLKSMRLIHRRYSFLVDDAETVREQKRVEARLEREIEIREADTLEDEYYRKHFYTFVSEFVNNKNVLDMGCGDGQGTFILAGAAASVTGVDTDGQSLRHASARYAHNNLRFSEWPVQEKVFDVVAAYGTAKTPETFEALTRQARGLLKEDGLFIAAIPRGKNLCAGLNGFDSYKISVEGNFKCSLFIGQGVYPVSMIFPLASGPGTLREHMVKRGKGEFVSAATGERAAGCLIVLASDRPLAESSVESSALVDVSKTLLDAKEKRIQKAEEDARFKDILIKNGNDHIAELETYAKDAEAVIRDKDAHIGKLETYAKDAEAVIRDKDAHIGKLETYARDAEAVIRDRDAHIGKLETYARDVEAAMRDKDSHIGNLEAVVKCKDERIVELAASLGEKDAYIQFIHSGHGWRLLNKYFIMRDKLLPAGSKRRTAAKELFRYILKVFSSKSTGNIEVKDRYQQWMEKNEPGPIELKEQSKTNFSYTPKISIVTPVYNPERKAFVEMMESVLAQTYDNWELCLADASTRPEVKKVINKYVKVARGKIKVKYLGQNHGIAGNTNEALSLASGDFIALLDHDDTLAPFALFEVVKAINQNPEIDFIYSDRDMISPEGRRFNPFFKPDWSPDFLLSQNYVCHLNVFKGGLIDKAGAFRAGYDGSQDYDLVLRATELARKIEHIPKVLYHWRIVAGSASGDPEAKPYAYDAAIRALQDAVDRRGWEGTVTQGKVKGLYRICFSLKDNPKVSIIIPTKDKADILKKCLDSIFEKTTYKNYEVVLVDNRSAEKETFEYYEELKSIQAVKMLRYDAPFNFSEINNYAVSNVESEYVLFLNNDVEIITPEWLEVMLGFARRKETGAVGIKLLYPDGKIQTAGLILDGEGNVRRSHYRYPGDSLGYAGRIQAIQNVSALAAACMMMRKEVFEEVGGFDPKYVVAHGDIDLCLKILGRKYLIVYEPHAELYHHESLTRGYEDTPEKIERLRQETELLMKRWGHVLKKGDPYFSPNLTSEKEDFTIRT